MSSVTEKYGKNLLNPLATNMNSADYKINELNNAINKFQKNASVTNDAAIIADLSVDVANKLENAKNYISDDVYKSIQNQLISYRSASNQQRINQEIRQNLIAKNKTNRANSSDIAKRKMILDDATALDLLELQQKQLRGVNVDSLVLSDMQKHLLGQETSESIYTQSNILENIANVAETPEQKAVREKYGLNDNITSKEIDELLIDVNRKIGDYDRMKGGMTLNEYEQNEYDNLINKRNELSNYKNEYLLPKEKSSEKLAEKKNAINTAKHDLIGLSFNERLELYNEAIANGDNEYAEYIKEHKYDDLSSYYDFVLALKYLKKDYQDLVVESLTGKIPESLIQKYVNEIERTGKLSHFEVDLNDVVTDSNSNDEFRSQISQKFQDIEDKIDKFERNEYYYAKHEYELKKLGIHGEKLVELIKENEDATSFGGRWDSKDKIKEIEKEWISRGIMTQDEIDDLKHYIKDQYQKEKNEAKMEELYSDVTEYNDLQELGMTIGSSPVAFGGNVLTLFDSIYQAGRELFGGEKRPINAYSDINASAQWAKTVREAVQADQSDAGKFFYGVGCSLLDMYMSIAASGGIGDSLVKSVTGKAVAGSLTKNITLASMSLNAGGGAALDAMEKTSNPYEVAAIGVSSAVFEALAEKLPLDNLFKIAGQEGKITTSMILKAMGSQAVSEFGEEAATETANIIMEAIVMGDKSDWAQTVQDYIDEGYSESEARSKALVSMVGRIGMSGLAGAISGGFSGGGASTINYLSYNYSIHSTGNTLIKNNQVERLIELAETSGIDISAYNLEGKKGNYNAKAIGELYFELMRNKSDAVSNALKEMGVSEADIAVVQGAVFREAFGQELSTEMQAKYNQYKDVIDNAMNDEASSLNVAANDYMLTSLLVEIPRSKASNTVTDVSGTDSADVNIDANIDTDIDTEVNVESSNDIDTATESEIAKADYLDNETLESVEENEYDKTIRLMDGRAKPLTEAQAYVQSVGRALGYTVVIDDLSRGGRTASGKSFKATTRGFFDGQTIYLHEGQTTFDAVVEIFKHEITHYSELNPEMYNKYADAVFDSKVFENWISGKAKGRSHPARLGQYRQSIIDIYEANGKTLDPTGADREIIANFTSEMLFNEKGNTLERFINEVNSEDRNAISRFIHDFISWLKARLKGEKVSLKIVKLENRFAAVLRNVDNTNLEQNNDENSYSFGDIDVYSEKQYNDYGWVTVNGILTGKELKQLYSQFADIKLLKHKCPKTPKGEYIIFTGNNYGMIDSVVFIKGTNKHPIITKIYTYESLDKTNREISANEVSEYEQRGYDNANEIIEAYAGHSVFSRYTLRDCLSYWEQKRQGFGTASNKNSGKRNFGTGSAQQNKATDKAGLDNSAFSMPENDNEVSYSFEITPEQDAEYLDAVNNGDMETAQRMVDEAAERAGYTNLFYHGAKNGGGFTEFKDWSYFTENKEYAKRYTDRNTNGSLYTTYVKLDNPFDTRNVTERKLFDSIRNEYGLSEVQDTGLPDWTDGYDIADYIDENELDYDGIVLDEGGDLVEGEPISRGLSYVIRKSAQIKSADPVTYDDNGNIIPLSERFNEDDNDIRYSFEITPEQDAAYLDAVNNGDMETAQRMVDEAARENGYRIKGHHGTDVRFTIFNREKTSTSNDFGQGFYFSSSEYEAEQYQKDDAFGDTYNKIDGIAYDNALEIIRDMGEDASDDALFTKIYNEEFDKELKRRTDEGVVINAYLKMENPFIVSTAKWITEEEAIDIAKNTMYADDVPDDIAISDWIHSIKAYAKQHDGKVDTHHFANNMGHAINLTNALLHQGKYDGILDYSIRTKFGSISDFHAIALYSNKIKDSSPVTYDDNGNVIPLSERFNEDDNDIRYSFEDDVVDKTSSLAERVRLGEISQTEYLNELQSLMNEATEKYGAIPKGENPKVDVTVPKQVSDKRNTRRFVRTVLESGTLTDEMVADTDEAILKDALSYVPISNEEAIKVAAKSLKNGTAERDWNKVANGDKIPSKHDIAKGEMLLKMYAENGDARKVMELVADLSEVATRAGQTVQAFSLLKKMSGVGQLYYIQKTVDKLNRDLEKKHKGKHEQITIDETLAGQLVTAKPGTETENIVDEIMQDIAEQVPVTFLDKWNAWRYLAMLGNPRTHIRNLFGNAVFMPAIKLKDTIKAGMEKAFVSQENRTTSVIVNKEYKDFAKSDFEKVADIITGNGKMNPSDAIREQQKIFKNKVLEGFRKSNFDALEEEDMIFLKMHYKRALGGFLQARNADLNNIDETLLNEARNYAIEEAQKATYRDASAFANTISRFSRSNKTANLLIEGILPFKKTPINIVKRGVEYSPAGLIKTLIKGTYDLKKGNITASQYIDGISSGLTGTGIFISGCILSSLGVAVGGLGYDDEDALKRLNGEQEYSIELFGKSYTVDWMAPACIPFFMGVEFTNMFDDDEKSFLSAFVDAAYGSLEPMINLSMLSGIRDTISAARYSDTEDVLTQVGGETISSYFSQALPTLFGQVARTFDDTRRSNFVPGDATGFEKKLYEFFQNAMGKTPILENQKMPYTDAFGEKDTNDNFFLRVFENMLSPGYSSTIKETDVNAELADLFKQTGDGAVIPRKASKSFTVGKKRIYLDADQYTQYNTKKGQLSQNMLVDLFNSKGYKSMTYTKKAEAVSEVYKYANALAKTEVSDYKLKGKYAKWKEYQGYGCDVSELIALDVADKDFDGSGRVSKSEYAEAVNNADMSQKQKDLLLGLNEVEGKSDYSKNKTKGFGAGDWYYKEKRQYIKITSAAELNRLRRNNVDTYIYTGNYSDVIDELWRAYRGY